MKKFLLSIFLLLSFFATSLFAVTSELAKNDDEVSKADPNRSFETYTTAELREYIAKLPQTESDPEVLEFEKLALSSDEYLRPLEMSLYYQGWGKDVFYQFTPLGYRRSNDELTRPTNKQMREGKGEVRNAQKAFLYAVLSKTLGIRRAFCSPIMNLCYLYYEGIGTPKNYERIKELYDAYIKNDESLFFRSANLVFFYYLSFTGECGFEKNAYTPIILYNWKNLYAGFFAPKRKDFIIELLSSNLYSFKGYYSFREYNALINIYSGKYNQEDADPVKKEFYEKELKKRREEQLNSKDYQITLNGNIKYSIFAFKYMPDFYSKEILNPEYSKEKAIELFIKIAKYTKAKHIKEKAQYPDNDMASSFISRCEGLSITMKREVYQAINFYKDLNEALPKIKALAIFPEDDFHDIQAEVSDRIKLYEHIEKNYY